MTSNVEIKEQMLKSYLVEVKKIESILFEFLHFKTTPFVRQQIHSFM